MQHKGSNYFTKDRSFPRLTVIGLLNLQFYHNYKLVIFFPGISHNKSVKEIPHVGKYVK